MNHAVLHCPDDALNKLEEISYLIKHGDKLAISDFLKVNESRLYAHPSSEDTVDSTEFIIDDSAKFFKVQTTTDDEGNVVPVEPGMIGNIPDL